MGDDVIALVQGDVGLFILRKLSGRSGRVVRSLSLVRRVARRRPIFAEGRRRNERSTADNLRGRTPEAMQSELRLRGVVFVRSSEMGNPWGMVRARLEQTHSSAYRSIHVAVVASLKAFSQFCRVVGGV